MAFHDLRRKPNIGPALNALLMLKELERKDKDFEKYSRQLNNSYGKLNWTITMPTREIVLSKKISIEQSPYFNSGAYGLGYKLQLTLFIRSSPDGLYATIGFEVRKGDNDNNLTWPFKMKTEIRFTSPDEQKEYDRIEFVPPTDDKRFSQPRENSTGNNAYILPDRIPSAMLDKMFEHSELLIKARLYSY